MLNPIWYWISGLAFVSGAIWFMASAWVAYQLVTRSIPLLGETRTQIQDLGDLAANAVGRASDTMDIVEMRVSETMGQATQAGVSVTKQALNFGSALAGLYVLSRVAGALRSDTDKRRSRGRRRKRQS